MEQNNSQNPGDFETSEKGAAHSGAFPPDLAELIAAWPTLSPALRAEIVESIRARSS
jgi:hypothetical protein